MSRYLAVRTHSDDSRSLFYVVDTATGLAVTTHGSWEDAKASTELANEEPDGATWNRGDTLTLRAHSSKPGFGLSYPGGTVIAAEDGISGGWDVYDSEDGGSFYGFSVAAVTRAPRFQCSQCKRILPEDAIVGTCPECRGNRLERIES